MQKFVEELISQLRNGEDIANTDAVKLVRWLDKKYPNWRKAT